MMEHECREAEKWLGSASKDDLQSIKRGMYYQGMNMTWGRYSSFEEIPMPDVVRQRFMEQLETCSITLRTIDQAIASM